MSTTTVTRQTLHAGAPAAGPGQHHHHDMQVPRGALLLAAALVLASVLAVGWWRASGAEVSSASRAPVVKSLQLQFVDLADGGVQVLQVRPGAPAVVLHTVDAGGGGFLRGTLRALVRQRRIAGLGAEVPFQLAAHADGRLTLSDPATGQRVDLESFGPTNAGVFARLLAAAQPSR